MLKSNSDLVYEIYLVYNHLYRRSLSALHIFYWRFNELIKYLNNLTLNFQ